MINTSASMAYSMRKPSTRADMTSEEYHLTGRYASSVVGAILKARNILTARAIGVPARNAVRQVSGAKDSLSEGRVGWNGLKS